MSNQKPAAERKAAAAKPDEEELKDMGLQTITIDPQYSPALDVSRVASKAPPAPSAPPSAPAPDAGQATSIMEVIARAARDPNVDIDKMERLLEMQKTILERDAEVEFTRSMAAAQAEMEPVARDADNEQTKSRYAKLETIVEAIVPIRTRHGFTAIFGEDACPKDEHIRVICDLSHIGGHSKRYWTDVPIDLTGPKGTQNKTRTHAHASTLTYGRRYLQTLIFDIAIKDDDDDGNASGSPTAAPLGADGLVSELQRNMLEKRLQDAGGDLARFCSYLNISDLERLPAWRMNEAMTLIAAKAAEKTKKERADV